MAPNETALIPVDTSLLQPSWASDVKALIDRVNDSGRKAIADYGFLEVMDEATKVEAEDALAELRKTRKTYEAERKNLTQFLYDAKAYVDKQVRNGLAPLDTVEQSLTVQTTKYATELARKQAEAEAEARRKAEAEGASDDIPEPVAEKVEVAAPAQSERVHYREVWQFSVEDEKKVPKRYWAVDRNKIADDVKEGLREIPGVKIWPEQVPWTR